MFYHTDANRNRISISLMETRQIEVEGAGSSGLVSVFVRELDDDDVV